MLDILAVRQKIPWKERKRFALIGRGKAADQELMLVKPQTFMNNSGEVLDPLFEELGVPCASLLVVHDDMDLPFGRLKIKKGGGSGGHKGVASIQSELGIDGFLHVKMGIGRPEESPNPEEYVLSPFSDSESDHLREFLEQGSEAVICIVREGVERAMNRFNKRESPDAPEGGTESE